MGRRGPPAKPRKLRLLQGNPSKRPLNDAEPEPPPGPVKMPSWLPKGRARTAWAEISALLEQMGLLTTADPQALSLLCDAYAEYVQARGVIVRKGMSYERATEGGSVIISARPEVAIAADAWRRVRMMLQEFGMTPSARSRVRVPGGGGEKKDPFEEFLGGRRSPN